MKGFTGKMFSVLVALTATALMTSTASAKQVIVVATGDPFEDTENLQLAVDTHTPGDTILLKGHFRLGMMISAYGFDGVIKGEGIDETFIEVAGYPPESVLGAPGPVYCVDPLLGQYKLAFGFEQVPGVELVMKNLTMFYDGGVFYQMEEEWFPLNLYAFVESYYGKEASVTFKDVRVATSDPLAERGIASWHGLPDVGPSSGSTSIVNCEALGVQRGFVGGGIDGGSFSIIGSLCVGNAVRGVNVAPAYNCKLDIKDNQFVEIGETGINVFNASGAINVNENMLEISGRRGINIGNSKGDVNVKNNAVYRAARQAIHVSNSTGVQVKDNYCEGFIAEHPNREAIRLIRSQDCLVANNTIAHSIGSKYAIRDIANNAATCKNNTYIGNRFIDTEVSQAALQVDGDYATVRDNDFRESGIPGNGPFSIVLGSLSSGVFVSQPISLLPWGNQVPVEQIIDWGEGNVIVITP